MIPSCVKRLQLLRDHSDSNSINQHFYSGFATRLNRPFPRHPIADEHISVYWDGSNKWAYVPTFSRYVIRLRLRRPHANKLLSRTPGRPSQGEVEAGGHGSGRSGRKVRLESIKGRDARKALGIPVFQRCDRAGYVTYLVCSSSGQIDRSLVCLI